jgi:acyl carrier protein
MAAIKEKVLKILTDITEKDYKEIFTENMSPGESLQLLPTESMLALVFVASIEDEFSIEFDDDEVDITFFESIDTVVSRIEGHL